MKRMAEEKTCFAERKDDKDNSRFLWQQSKSVEQLKERWNRQIHNYKWRFQCLHSTFGIESQQEYGRLEKYYQPVWPSWQL